MSGDIKESAEESKRFTISTTERYEAKITGHYLILETWVKDNQTGDKILAHKHKHKLPKKVPTWITTHDLWQHSRGELLDLAKLTKLNGERRPSKKTLNQWKQSLELKESKKQRVLQSHNNHEQIP